MPKKILACQYRWINRSTCSRYSSLTACIISWARKQGKGCAEICALCFFALNLAPVMLGITLWFSLPMHKKVVWRLKEGWGFQRLTRMVTALLLQWAAVSDTLALLLSVIGMKAVDVLLWFASWNATEWAVTSQVTWSHACVVDTDSNVLKV